MSRTATKQRRRNRPTAGADRFRKGAVRFPLLPKGASRLQRLIGPVWKAKRRPRLRLDRSEAVLYAVGDVHGCIGALLRLEELIRRDAEGFPGRKILVMLGDYVDRGAHSAQVLAHLLGPDPVGFERICLCGNHEEMMLRFLAEPLANLDWLDLGGDATLASYGIDIQYLMRLRGHRPRSLARTLREAVGSEHIAFLRELPVLVFDDEVAFAHAGVAPGIELEAQSDHDLLWIREPFLSYGPRLPLVVVHGHTPTERPFNGLGRIGIDTGVFTTGTLTALRIVGRRGRFMDSGGGTGVSVIGKSGRAGDTV